MAARTAAFVVLVTLVLGVGARSAAADEASDAADRRRALVLLRVLAYDRNLGARTGDQATVLVVGDDTNAVDERDRWLTALGAARKVKVAGRAVVARAHAYTSEAALAKVVRDLRPAAIVVCGGLGASLGAVRKIARANKVMTFSTRADEVALGFAAGIAIGARRDTIIVNVAAAQAEGVQFEAGLLQVALRVGEVRR